MSYELTGAWMHESNNEEQILLFVDGYTSHTRYSKIEKKFFGTSGGAYSVDNSRLIISVEFDTNNNDQTGQSFIYNFIVNGNELTIDVNGKKTVYKKVDDASAPLSGAWHITSQMREGKLVPIHRTGTRKTVKILSGTRFQWVAIDPGTKEFFGTGGGAYEFANGKYTERIDFFSKDNNRVGASLSFDGKLEDGEWRHSGLSSRGETIYEIWSKVNM